MNETETRPTGLYRYALGVLVYTVGVILWGAFVRATGSGAGCGAHWPLCNGQVVPREPAVETLIEFSHRLTSGVALLLVFGLLVWTFRRFGAGHPARLGAGLSTLFIITEALVGAGLVLLELVATNASIARAYWMAGHLVNTFLLLGSLALALWWIDGRPRLRWRGQGALAGWLVAALLGTVVLGSSGAVTALGDTLVLTAGISPGESPVVAQLVALRVYHPLLAFAVGGLLLVVGWLALRRFPAPSHRRLVQGLGGIYLLQLLLGALNVALKAPVWLQLTHLLLSNLIWIGLVWLAATVLSTRSGHRPVADSSRAMRAALH